MDRDREGLCLLASLLIGCFIHQDKGSLNPPKIHSDCMGVLFSFCILLCFGGELKGGGCVNQCWVSTQFGELDLLVLVVLVSKNQTWNRLLLTRMESHFQNWTRNQVPSSIYCVKPEPSISQFHRGLKL
jgi:hypothetical protein